MRTAEPPINLECRLLLDTYARNTTHRMTCLTTSMWALAPLEPGRGRLEGLR
jgi:hypothetical protein